MGQTQQVHYDPKTGEFVDGSVESADPNNKPYDGPGITYRDVNKQNEATRQVTRAIGNPDIHALDMQRIVDRHNDVLKQAQAAEEAGDTEEAKRLYVQVETLRAEHDLKLLQADHKPQSDTGVTERGEAQLRRELAKLESDGVFAAKDNFK